MKEKTITVYLYFLEVNADDILVFYDAYDEIAAISYKGMNTFLNDSDAIRHCFEEGYIERQGERAFVLYGFTDDKSIALSFEATRNMDIFHRKTLHISDDEFLDLNRFKEGKLRMEAIQYGTDKYMGIVMSEFEILTITNMREEDLVCIWDESCHIFEFMPMENGYSFMDECLSDSLNNALNAFKFKYLLGEIEPCPAEGVDINEWNLFYLYFSDTLC